MEQVRGPRSLQFNKSLNRKAAERETRNWEGRPVG